MDTSERKETTSSEFQNNKNTQLVYEKPTVEILGRMEELTGSMGGSNNDGHGYRGCV